VGGGFFGEVLVMAKSGCGCLLIVAAFMFFAVNCTATRPVNTAVNKPPAAPQAIPQPPQAPAVQPEPEAQQPQAPKWVVSTHKDSLTDEEFVTSSLQSSNTVDLKFPYNGEQRGRLVFRQKGGKTDVWFSIEKGQLFPGALLTGDAIASIRVDDTLIKSRLGQATGYDTATVFILDERIPQLIMSGRELRIEVELFQESNKVFVFDLTSGR
jgi:hypothetical protein